MNLMKNVGGLVKCCGNPSLIKTAIWKFLPASFSTSTRKLAVDYDPNPSFKSPSPYKIPKPFRYGYKGKIFTGGLLPRHDGEDVKSLPLKDYKPRNRWREKSALFGQNDYIDILGDGDLQPHHLTKGPKWIVGGFKGDEYRTIIRRLKFNRLHLEEYRPTKLHQIQKRVNYLYKRFNHRRHRGFYKGQW